MTLIICPIKKCQRLRNVLSNSVPSMTNTKETLRPIRECFLNSPIKECSYGKVSSQRDLHRGNFPKRLASPIRECFYSYPKRLAHKKFPKETQSPIRKCFCNYKRTFSDGTSLWEIKSLWDGTFQYEHSLMGLFKKTFCNSLEKVNLRFCLGDLFISRGM